MEVMLKIPLLSMTFHKLRIALVIDGRELRSRGDRTRAASAMVSADLQAQRSEEPRFYSLTGIAVGGSQMSDHRTCYCFVI